MKEDIDELINTKDFLNNEVERLMQENQEFSNELSSWRNKYAVFSQLTEKIEDNLVKFFISFALIES